MKITILVLFTLVTTDSYAQKFQKCLITLDNGEKHEGFIKNFHSNAKDFSFRANRKSKKVKFKSSEIAEIALYYNHELGIYTNHYLAKYNKSCTKLKEYNHNCWAAQIYDSDAIEAYQYVLKSRNHISIISPSNTFSGGSPFIPYNSKDLRFAIKFPHIGYLIEIAESNKGAEELDSKRMKRKMIKYMSLHCASFASGIENKKDELNNFNDLLEYYTEVCK